MRRIKIPLGVKIFIAIWLLALCVPIVRDLPGALALYDLRGIEGPDDYVDMLDLPPSNDPMGEAWRAEVEVRRGDKGAMDAVAARFPTDVRVKALQLLIIAKELPDLKQARLQPNAASDSRWKKGTQIARRAAVLDAENVFWPWMEAAFEFAARRDDAALNAFARAAKCTRYQDYSDVVNRERIAWLEARRSMAWEQKLMLSSAVGFPQLRLLHQSMVGAGQRAGALRKSGQIGRALSIENGALNASSLARRDATYEITATFAQNAAIFSVEQFLNIKPLAPERQGYLIESEAHARDLAKAWTQFVIKQGRPDIAPVAAFIGEPSVFSMLRSEGDHNFQLEIYGVKSSSGDLSVIAPYVLLVLSLTIGLGALFWLGSLPLHFKVQEPTRGQVALCANFSFWLFAASAVVYCALYSHFLDPLSGREFWSITKVAPAIFALAIFCWILPIEFISWRRARAEAKNQPEIPTLTGVRLWLTRLLWFIASASLILMGFTVFWGGTAFDIGQFNALAVIMAAIAMMLSWSVAQRQFKFRFQLAHHSAGVLVVIWSVVFLAMSLGVWPLRAQLNKNLDRKIQIGEIAWMREQIAKAK